MLARWLETRGSEKHEALSRLRESVQKEEWALSCWRLKSNEQFVRWGMIPTGEEIAAAGGL